MPLLNGFVAICFSVLLIAFLGFYNVIVSREENGCNMTYMFEYPQYVKVSLGPDVAKKFKAYSLYAYGEGRFTEKVREMKFKGIPVLFIHGHRGSYKQVRSLSSVSLRKALRSRTPFHFDYFSVDLNEEYSGISGGVLEKQTDFVRICIEKILSLYRGSEPPDSVVLFGHSMGGMIAKGLFLRDMGWSKVRLIVTLATPHTPAFVFDPATSMYYDEVTRLWDETEVGQNVTVVSIGGGSRDLVVHSGLVFTPHADVSVISSEVSGVWLEMDHLCITWCKELILVLVRALFDSVDLDTNQISTKAQHRESVFNYHLLERSGSKQYGVARGDAPGKETVLWKGESDTSSWLRLRKNQLTWNRRDRISVTTNILVPLSSLTQPADTLVIRTINHNTEHWLFACKPDVPVNNIKICSTGEDISWRGRISPTKDYKRKTAVIDLIDLKMQGKTHLVVRTLPTSDMVEVSFDLFVNSERGAQLQPGFLVPHDLIHMSTPGELYRWFQIPHLARPWHAFILRVLPHPSNCSATGGHSTAIVEVPWQHEGSHVVFSEDRLLLPITTYTPKPPRSGKNVLVSVYLNPECSYTIRLEQSLALAIGRIIVRNYPSFLAFLSVCLIMCLAKQLRCLGEVGDCPLLHFVAATATKPYYVLPAANIAAAIARFCYPYAPKSDVHHHSGLVETLFLPLLLHCSAVALLLIFASLVLVGVVFHGQAFNSVVLKFVSKLCLGLPWISEWIMKGVSKLPIIISGLMLAISYTACSSLAIYIGLIFYFVRLVSYYEDFWDEVVYWPMKAIKAAVVNKFTKRCIEIKPLEIPPIRDISFHLTLFLMWAVIALITTPSVLTWAHNYKYSSSLENDPFLPTGIALSLCGGFLWQVETPRTHLKWSDEVSRFVLSGCVGALVYCQTSLYRLQALLCMVLLSVCCHQLAATADPPPDQPSSTTPSVLSTATASFLKHLDTLLGNRTPRPDSRISGEISDIPLSSRLDTDESESSDRAELSAEMSTDISERAELSELLSEASFLNSGEKLSCEDKSSAASFDPADRPVGEQETDGINQHQFTNQNTASLSSNSSFENISIAEMVKDK